MERLSSLNVRVNTLKKVPNESSSTESSHTINVNNKENSNTNQKQDKPVLKNQLKDWNYIKIMLFFIIFLRHTLPIVTTPQSICYQSLSK